MATLKDISNKTGFSVSTVSKALRGNSEIGEQTRSRVVQVARDLGYLDKAGRSKTPRPVSGVIGTVGVIGPEIRSSYFAQIVSSIEEALREQGYGMLLGLSDFAYDQEQLVLNRFMTYDLAGIICVTISDRIDFDLRTIRQKHEVPIVLLAPLIAFDDFDYVKVNDHFGVKLAVEHLLCLGHTDIAFVGDQLSSIRAQAFVEIMRVHSIEVPEGRVLTGTERFERSGYLLMRELLKSTPLPTAVLASYDDVAIGVIRAAQEAGLRVPEELSVVGFDGIEVGAFLAIPLTTVGSPTEEMASRSVEILTRKIVDKTFSIVQHLSFNPQLVVRGTTGSPSR